ncbi:MAG: di-trans,poly-cis-decaprenylcistransferase [Spirochaetes bacterium GWD1_27_9]|nr:MAG: di-trans,poly-cis-decaprenylcistransferase [Spirochaetes bacterium GWB1_27_13]OHD22116.1 MAG: di-trans,poly-cis-decaprenylcistransferase [Spirochaetes bacterium GWC1_27_15]OHD28989.1 MAG: di-trans,poly-cis-decaprenylcistransferase [Spirochaetes bacterium GWD1_27_9]
MDGNGRWAKKRNLPRTAGHSAGVQKAKEVVLLIKELGIPFVSLYTFSKENWKRSMDEVSFLMGLIVKHLEEEFDFYIRNKIRIRHLGDKEGLPEKVVKAIERVEKESKDFTALTVLLAINYSGKYDITQAINKILNEKKESVTEEDVEKYLLTKDIPDPELIIRTSGEFRVSNYFLWQAAYSEFYVTQTLWPDLKKEDITLAIDSFKSRDRRFGGVKDE